MLGWILAAADAMQAAMPSAFRSSWPPAPRISVPTSQSPPPRPCCPGRWAPCSEVVKCLRPDEATQQTGTAFQPQVAPLHATACCPQPLPSPPARPQQRLACLPWMEVGIISSEREVPVVALPPACAQWSSEQALTHLVGKKERRQGTLDAHKRQSSGCSQCRPQQA